MPIIVPTITWANRRICMSCLSRKIVLNARFNRIQNWLQLDVGNEFLLGNVTTLSFESNNDVVHTSDDALFCDVKSSLVDRLISVWSVLLLFLYVSLASATVVAATGHNFVDSDVVFSTFVLLISLAIFLDTLDIPCNWIPISFSVSRTVFVVLCVLTAITKVGTEFPYSPLATSITKTKIKRIVVIENHWKNLKSI